MKKITQIALVIFSIVLFSADLYAQTGGFAGSYARMGFGPRGMAMGNAMASVTERGMYSHYNPAMNAFAQRSQVDLATSAMSFDRELHAAAFSFRLPPSAGLQLQLLNANVRNFDGRTQSGYHTNYFSTYEFLIAAGFGVAFSERFAAGVNIKGIVASFYEDVPRSSGAGLDIGFLYKANSSLHFGFTIMDIVSGYRWDTTELYGSQLGSTRNDNFPTRFVWAASYRMMENSLILSSEFELMRLSTVITQSQNSLFLPPSSIITQENLTQSNKLVRMGGFYRLHERFSLSTGLEIRDIEEFEDSLRPSLGFSLYLPFDRFSPSVDYALIREQTGVSWMHSFAIRLEF